VVELKSLLDAGCEMPVGNELLAEAEE